MQTVTLDTAAAWESALQAACRQLLAGGVIAAPTDTVYGLMTRWDNAAGRQRILQLKHRSPEKHFQMLVPDLATACAAGVRPDPRLTLLAERLWPGPITIVCPAAGDETIGVRVPDHRFMAALLRRLATPLAATSANLSGNPPGCTSAQAIAELDGEPDLVVDGGPTPVATASTVVALTPAGACRILRPGPVSEAEITAILSGPGSAPTGTTNRNQPAAGQGSSSSSATSSQ